jgi:hypothetical protein
MPRTILEIVRSAAPRIGIARPDQLFGNTSDESVEIRAVLQEAADRIVRAHDWSKLKVEETHTGDGVTEGFALPADYIRMAKEAQIWSTRWQHPLAPVTAEEWLRLDVREYDLIVGTWIILEGQVKYRPPLATGETGRFFYISDLAVAPASGANKARFTADTDTFRLGDRILELALIWEWRAAKGLPYEEHMATAETALAQAISDDKGARIIAQSSRRNFKGKMAYPWGIVP